MTFDPDFGKTGFARRLFRLRFRELRVSQKVFAETYGIPFGTVRDIEQGRHKPSGSMRVLVELIERNPRAVAQAAKAVRRAESQ